MRDIFIGIILGFILAALVIGMLVIKEINETLSGKFDRLQAQIDLLKK